MPTNSNYLKLVSVDLFEHLKPVLFISTEIVAFFVQYCSESSFKIVTNNLLRNFGLFRKQAVKYCAR